MFCHSSLQACRMLHTHAAWPCSSACSHVRRPLRTLTIAMARPWRPEVDDVDRLAKGGAAKKRGTGNRNIPHRLNAEEKPVYDSAKKKGYLAVKGTGYRRARKGNPLPNIYRQWCDARATPCIVVEQPLTGSEPAVVVVDLAPLRLLDCSEWEGFCRTLAAAAGAKELLPPQRTAEDVPFNIIPLASLCEGEEQVVQVGSSHAVLSPASAATTGGEGADGGSVEAGPSTSSTAAAAAAVADQAAVVKALKDSGLTNQDPDVQREVQVLLKLKRQLQDMQEGGGAHNGNTSTSTIAIRVEPASSHSQHHHGSAGGGSSSSTATEARQSAPGGVPTPATSRASSSTGGSNVSDAEPYQATTATATAVADVAVHAAAVAPGPSRREVLPDGHPYATAAIWQLPARPLFFEVDRTAAKQLAKDLMAKAR